MQSKTLPIAETPIKAFLSWAYTLSISLVLEDTQDWMYSNFIQLCCNKDSLESINSDLFLDFWRGGRNELAAGNPFLLSRNIGYDAFIPKWYGKDIVLTLESAIKENMYPVIFLDESKLSYSTEFSTGCFYPHHCLIFGFDNIRKKFKVKGFGQTERESYFGVFDTYEVPYDQMVAATERMSVAIHNHQQDDHLSYFYTPKVSPFHDFPHSYRLTLETLRRETEEFLNSSTSNGATDANRDAFVFGLNVFKELENYFQFLHDGGQLNLRNEVRHLSLLKEHKVMFTQRIHYLMTKGLLTNGPAVESLLGASKKSQNRLQMMILLSLKNTKSNVPNYFKTMLSFIKNHQGEDKKQHELLLRLIS